MSETNPFGGKNPNSLYVPMSEIEQEFIDRLRTSGDLKVTIVGWGRIDSPVVQQGDHQVVIPIDITFTAPSPPIPVSYFDMELSSHSGVVFFREKQSVQYDGKPIEVGAGTRLQMVWHIGIRAIDPALIKAYLPGVHGLTSRSIDKDTGNITDLGNMKLSTVTKQLLKKVRNAEGRVRLDRDQTVGRYIKKG